MALLLVFWLALPGAVRAADEKQFDARSFTLANALQVVVVENHRAPIATP